MRDGPVSLFPVTGLAAGVLIVSLAAAGGAEAFPFIDSLNRDSVAAITGTGGGAPLGTELPSSDTKSLKGQLSLTNPAPAGNRSGWTITPRFSMQEMFTDNALEVKAPRRFDAVTVFAPGIAILAETSRINLNLDYQPSLYLHAINGPLNAVTQQLNMTGLITAVPDLAFIDVRALSGVQSRYAGLAGSGSIGASNSALAPASSGAVGGAGGGGLNRQNEVQTSSYGISPYLQSKLGDYGSGKLGMSLNASRSSSISGLGLSPFPTGGANGQSLTSTEQIASFTTGEFLGKLQATFSANLSQSNSHSDGQQQVIVNNTPTTIPGGTFTSQRELYNVQLSYALNRTFTLLGSIGKQSVHYSQGAAQAINGITWDAGLTVTPDPDTTMTLKYGHVNGTDSLTANARYALSGRTNISMDYTSSIGTQLEHLQSQLNGAALDASGHLVQASNGVAGLTSLNALGANGGGVFRYNTLNVTGNSTWERDTIQGTLSWSIQTSISTGGSQLQLVGIGADGQPFFTILPPGSAAQSTDLKTFGLSWTHDLSPDLKVSTSGSYTFTHRNGTSGNDSALSTAIGLQYTLSDNSNISARYSFFDRISRIQGYSLYENLLILGFTKKF